MPKRDYKTLKIEADFEDVLKASFKGKPEKKKKTKTKGEKPRKFKKK